MEEQPQEPLTFEDVTVFLSRAEWDALALAQRELYRDVVSGTYELLTSLGYPGPKPDILHRLERGEEPWVCPSPEPAGSWLEEPSSDWWHGASGFQGPEPSCPAGWSTSWCLQDRTFQEEFGPHEGKNEFLSEEDSGLWSQVQPWLVKEEVEEKPELMEDLPQSETFLLHSVTEEQSLDPWEQLWDDPTEWTHENTQNHGHTLGEATLLLETWEPRVEELRAAAAKDHSYCLRSEPAAPCAPSPCSLWEHGYCRRRRAARSPRAGAARVLRRWRAWLRSRCARTVRTARGILRRYRPYRRPGFPWRGCSSCRAAARATGPGVRPPTELRNAADAGGVTADAPRAPEGSLESVASPPAPVAAVGARMGAQPREDPRASRERAGRSEPRKSSEVSLQDMFRNVLNAIGYMLDSLCQKFELQGFSQVKNIWPIVIQIDNLGEMGKHRLPGKSWGQIP